MSLAEPRRPCNSGWKEQGLIWLVHTFASSLAVRRYGTAVTAGAVNISARMGRGRLEVIGAGFGRTGTMSLKLALEQLGFGPCYHMTEIVKNPGHMRLWRIAHSGQPVDWAELFSRYRAAVDWPVCHYYCDLMSEFPDAKVILTLRDSRQWYESMTNTLYSLKTAAVVCPEPDQAAEALDDPRGCGSGQRVRAAISTPSRPGCGRYRSPGRCRGRRVGRMRRRRRPYGGSAWPGR